MKKKYRIREGSIARYAVDTAMILFVFVLFSLPSTIENLFF